MLPIPTATKAKATKLLPPSLQPAMRYLWPDADKLEYLAAMERPLDELSGLPALHAAQERVKRDRARFNVLCCGRRWGKNVLLQHFVLEAVSDLRRVAWAAPGYKQLTEDWRDLLHVLAPHIERKNEQEKQIRLKGGGVVDFWTLENAEMIRGRRYHRFIVNEGGIVPRLMDIWTFIIRPTLIDFRGDFYVAGTPRGRNGFWQLYETHEPDWARWQMPSTVNPHVPADELDELACSLPEQVYRQEILAEFLEDGGMVFRRVLEAATATPREPEAGRQYVAGVDWARSNDYTVFTLIDLERREQVYLDRFNNIDYEIQTARLRSMMERYRPVVAFVEYNAMGGPIVERLQSEGWPVNGFVTTNATKEVIIRQLESAFENGEIRILPDPAQTGELQAYEQERLASGWRFGAPDGSHDDTVMALALAWHAAVNSRPVKLLW